MSGGIKRKLVKVSIPVVAYKQLQNLAAQEGQLISEYVKNLISRHLVSLGLPVYFDLDAEMEAEAQAKAEAEAREKAEAEAAEARAKAETESETEEEVETEAAEPGRD